MPRSEGELTRAIVHDPDEQWPVKLEVVAYFGEKRRHRRSVEINADHFFGRNGYGAPMAAETLFRIIDGLRKAPK
jgi:hypothetical protein